jgi:hypothetical protein
MLLTLRLGVPALRRDAGPIGQKPLEQPMGAKDSESICPAGIS